MPLFDLPLDQLRSYQPQTDPPADLEGFWRDTISESRQFPMNARFQPIDCGLSGIQAFDVTYPGFGGQEIKAWYLLPANIQPNTSLPCIIEYIGYGGGRGFAHQWLLWPCAGYATLVMDTRGQGSAWQNGDTPDVEGPGSNPQFPGFMTRGILNPTTYYYRRVHTDAVRAIEAVLTRPEIDLANIFLTGGSQGGGITIAVAAIVGGIAPITHQGKTLALRGIMADVPFLCQYRRATEITAAFPYQEIVQFLKNQRAWEAISFRTLSYFDNLNLAPYAAAPALFSVALMDDICPPSTVFSAFNAYGNARAPDLHKEIRVYPYNGHEQGQQFQTTEKLNFAKALMKT